MFIICNMCIIRSNYLSVAKISNLLIRSSQTTAHEMTITPILKAKKKAQASLPPPTALAKGGWIQLVDHYTKTTSPPWQRQRGREFELGREDQSFNGGKVGAKRLRMPERVG